MRTVKTETKTGKGLKFFSNKLHEEKRLERLNEIVVVTCARCGKSKRARLMYTNQWFNRHRGICRGR